VTPSYASRSSMNRHHRAAATSDGLGGDGAANKIDSTRPETGPEQHGRIYRQLQRYLGVGTGLLREVAEDTEIGGQPVAAGDFVVVAIQSANRDPELAADADTFDMGRHPVAHLGFGHGPHQCVGQQLAWLELTTVLAALPGRIPTLRLAIPFAEIDFKTDTVIRGPSTLPVTWETVLAAPWQAGGSR